MAEYPIIMKQKNDQGDYDTLYPKTLGSQVEGTIPSSQITGTFPSSSITGQFPASQIDDIYTKDQTLTQATAALFGLDTNAVPDDVLAYLGKYAQYWWRRRTTTGSMKQQTVSNFSIFMSPPSDKLQNVYVSDSAFSGSEGILSLAKPLSLSRSYNEFDSGGAPWRDRYVLENTFEQSGATGFFVNSDATYTRKNPETCEIVVSAGKKFSFDLTDWEYVQSSERSAYPDSGWSGKYQYEYLGVPFQNSVDLKIATQKEPIQIPKIVFGSYVGTGKAGAQYPNVITSEFPMKFIWIYGYRDTDANNQLVNFIPIFGANYIVLPVEEMSTSYSTNFRLAGTSSVSYAYEAKRSEDFKSVYWYGASRQPENQLNEQYHKYFYVIVG